MRKRFKIRTIEDIALQFIKYDSPEKTKEVIRTNETIMDSKLIIKKYVNSKNSDSCLSQSFERLVPIQNKKKNDIKIKGKLIEFYKIPQKILGDEDDCSFDGDSSMDKKINSTSSKILKQSTFKSFLLNNNIKLRAINPLIYNKKPFFNLNYQNIYECLTELYSPLLQNLESIASLKATTNIIISRIEFFCSHSSVFEMNLNDNYISEIMEELKIFEVVELSMVLFLLHIILEARIEYMDSFNEDDILIVYQDSYLALQKLYEIVILILLLDDKNKKLNFSNNPYIGLCDKYIQEFYKYELKPNNEQAIIEQINDNIFSSLKILFNCCNILYGNLILFKKDSGNLEFPEDDEAPFLEGYNNNIISSSNNKQRNDKIFLSKEFNDQYSFYKTMYLYFTNSNSYGQNKGFLKENNFDFLSPKISSEILKRLNTVFSSYKELSNCFLLYYTNFKILIEKNKVKPPFLPPLDTKKYAYTLVVDLDETLVHYIEEENRAYVQVRPYTDYFLTEMSKYFEIVIFTAAAEDYTDIVLNELDKNKIIKFKLYRKHTEQINGIFIKDLSKLGRDINKVIIIDNNKDNFSLQPENGLHICSFLGDQNDDELYALSEDLMKIVNSNKDDIRPIIKEIDGIMKERYAKKNIILE